MLAFENNELIGSSIIDRVAPSHREKILRIVQLRAKGSAAPNFHETRGVRTDGVEFVEFNVTTYELKGETYTLATIRDITEKQKAEAELHALNEGMEQRITQRTAELHKTKTNLENINAKLSNARLKAEAANLTKSDSLSNMSHELSVHR